MLGCSGSSFRLLGICLANVPCHPPAGDSSAGRADPNSACSLGSFSNGNRASDDSGLSCPEPGLPGEGVWQHSGIAASCSDTDLRVPVLGSWTMLI